MKKLLVFLVCLLTVVTLVTGCSSEKKTDTESTPPVSSEVESPKTEAPTTEPSESLPEETESTESVPAEVTATTPVEGLSDKYVDLDNRSFSVNGNVYTLGVSTLQDMIDDGVPFKENAIANANNNLNPNYESSGFGIVLGEYYTAQVSVANYTENNATMNNCVLSQVYLTVHPDKEQNIMQFAFPLNMTEDQLIAQAGDPTDRHEYKSDDGKYDSHTLEYTMDSEKYIGDSGYEFKFTNGELEYITIDWKP